MKALSDAFSLLLSGDRELYEIITTTLVMSFFSTLFSSLVGLPLGIVIGRAEFRLKGGVMKITNTLMSLPPVVAGLVVFLLFRSIGPLGTFHLMFSVPIMVIAQVVLISPIITGLTAAAAEEKSRLLSETATGMGLSRVRQTALLLRECAGQLAGIVLLGFGRSIAEVGAVSLVGGNIQHKTRVMTTAILLEANKGSFETALALGVILMLISLAVNIIAHTVSEKMH